MNISTQNLDIASRAMLAQLSIAQWSGRKLDRKVTKEVNQNHGAAHDAGRYNKSLVAKTSLAEITSIAGKARADHAYVTLPWFQDGTRIMPAAAFSEYSAKMAGHREAFELAVESFISSYPAYVDEARIALNGMFNDADYPDAAEIRRRFSWSINILPLPSSADFRVDLDSAKIDHLKAAMQTTVDGAVIDAMRDAWSRLHSAIRAMADKLTAYKPATQTDRAQGVFRDSLVSNLVDLIEVLPVLNITGDANLAAIIERARSDLARYDADALRDNDQARTETAEAAEKIADDMAAFMVA